MSLRFPSLGRLQFTYLILYRIVQRFSFAGMCAIRAERDYTIDEDFMKAVRKLADAKKLETKLDYKPV